MCDVVHTWENFDTRAPLGHQWSAFSSFRATKPSSTGNVEGQLSERSLVAIAVVNGTYEDQRVLTRATISMSYNRRLSYDGAVFETATVYAMGKITEVSSRSRRKVGPYSRVIQRGVIGHPTRSARYGSSSITRRSWSSVCWWITMPSYVVHPQYFAPSASKAQTS